MGVVIRISIPGATVETRTVGDDVHIDIGPGAHEGSTATQTTPGKLAPMIKSGDLKVGEVLYWLAPPRDPARGNGFAERLAFV